jgi:D-alanine-D-alanine ligase
MKNVIVVFGGKSCEHEISIITGVLTLNSIDKQKYSPFPVYISKNGEWLTGEELFDLSFYKCNNFSKLKKITCINGERSLYYKSGKKLKKINDAYCAINCLHGLNGEDGAISGVMQLNGVPLVGSPLFASSLSMDKEYQKFVLNGLKIPVLPFVSVTKKEYLSGGEYIEKVESKLSYPVIIKPANLGSSIGISTANNKSELVIAVKNAFIFDEKVVIEPYLQDFTEYNIGALETQDGIILSSVEKPIKSSDILSFQDKYENTLVGESKEFPAKISKNLKSKINAITEKVYKSCGFSGVIRIDYIYSQNKLYLNEINSIPGSLSYYLFCDSVKEFKTLLTSLIEKAVANFNGKSTKIFSYTSGVLKVEGAKGGKRLTRNN